MRASSEEPHLDEALVAALAFGGREARFGLLDLLAQEGASVGLHALELGLFVGQLLLQFVAAGLEIGQPLSFGRRRYVDWRWRWL